jgi:hypothetical protein
MYVCFGIVKWNEGWAECKIFAECVTAMLIVKRKPEIPHKMYNCENWKAQNRLLFVV